MFVSYFFWSYSSSNSYSQKKHVKTSQKNKSWKGGLAALWFIVHEPERPWSWETTGFWLSDPLLVNNEQLLKTAWSKKKKKKKKKKVKKNNSPKCFKLNSCGTFPSQDL